MKLARIFPMVALALVLAACGGAAALRSSESAGAPAQLAPQAPAGGAAPALEGNDASATGSGGQPPADQQGVTRLVIKSADISLQVETVRDAEVAVRAKVNELGGYIVRVETNGTDQNLTSHITFRVPAERFDDALTGLQGLAQKVLSRTVSGDDVTEEFVDLESRLRNLEATRDRLQEFLDKATTVEEALKVNDSLSQIQGQIEQLKGRAQFLQQSAALSTITVYLTPVPVIPLVAEDSWQPVGVAREALSGLIGFGQGLAELAIVILIWTPVWLPLILLARWGWRRLRSGRRPLSAEPLAETGPGEGSLP